MQGKSQGIGGGVAKRKSGEREEREREKFEVPKGPGGT